MAENYHFDVEALEELFIDELEFKIRSMILLLAYGKFTIKLITANLARLDGLSRRNLEIIHSYDKQL